MTTVAQADTIKTLTTHYIDGAFVESHGLEVMDVIKPTDGKVIARVTLDDEEEMTAKTNSNESVAALVHEWRFQPQRGSSRHGPIP